MATTKKTKAEKEEKEAGRIIALQRRSLKRRQALINKLESIHDAVTKIKNNKIEAKYIICQKNKLNKALYHIESAMLCINQY